MWAVRIFSAEEAKESENEQRCNSSAAVMIYKRRKITEGMHLIVRCPLQLCRIY